MPTDNILPLLETLRDSGVRFVQSVIGQASESRLYKALGASAGTSLTSNEKLADLIKDDDEFSTAAQLRYIRLEDVIGGGRTFSPLIYLDGDFRQEHPKLRVQIILVAYNSATGNETQSLLLRFETPEGLDPAGSGKHDYYHSQLCTSFRVSGTQEMSIKGSVSWLGASCPAWPMDAKTPLHLLACVIFALYGKRDGVRMLQQAYGDQLKKYLEGMHFVLESSVSGTRRRVRRRTERRRR